MDKIRANRKKLIMILLVCTVIMWLLNIGLGAVSISLSQMWEVLVMGEESPTRRILLYVRIPRTCGAALCGMGLAVSGAVIQTVLGNTLAGPNIIGVNAGAGFVVVLCGSLLPGMYGMVPLGCVFWGIYYGNHGVSAVQIYGFIKDHAGTVRYCHQQPAQCCNRCNLYL